MKNADRFSRKIIYNKNKKFSLRWLKSMALGLGPKFRNFKKPPPLPINPEQSVLPFSNCPPSYEGLSSADFRRTFLWPPYLETTLPSTQPCSPLKKQIGAYALTKVITRFRQDVNRSIPRYHLPVTYLPFLLRPITLFIILPSMVDASRSKADREQRERFPKNRHDAVRVVRNI